MARLSHKIVYGDVGCSENPTIKYFMNFEYGAIRPLTFIRSTFKYTKLILVSVYHNCFTQAPTTPYPPLINYTERNN